MKLRLATERDSEALINFYADSEFTTPIHLKLRKKGSFFFQYNMQSDDFSTYILEDPNEQNAIKAMISIVFRQGIIENELCTIGYVTDLRISSERKVILEWAHSLLPVLRQAKAERNCRYIFSVVAEAQQQAMNAFIRPRNVRRELPRYYLYRRFHMVSLHGLWPWALPPLNSIITEKGTQNDLEDLAKYISLKTKERVPNYHPSTKEVLNSIEKWPGLNIEDFIIARDSKGHIVGCTALWCSIQHEEFIPIKYDSKSLTLKELLHLYSFISSARRLSDVDIPLKFYYLSYLFADNSDIFYSLCFKSYQSVNKDHFLIYPHFEGSLMTQPAKSFISSRVKAGLYCLLDSEEKVPDFLKPRVLSPPPDFELAFI
ncbi:MAG: hypothetical protein KDD58_14805 [Bdellovibrionales bacterium]|nr:hypothetical protein [Bdellovibrionales bacterium]